MPDPASLDRRIEPLVPKVDEEIQTRLPKVLQTLRSVGYAEAVANMMSPLTLRLFRLIYAAAGKPVPGDNLFGVLAS